MWDYVLSLMVGWLVVQMISTLHAWRQRCLDVRGIPTLPDCHFLWGVLSKIHDSNDFIKLVTDHVIETRVRLFSVWSFVNVSVFPSHPATIKQVMQAANVPKNTSTTGAYRLLTPWLGDGLLISSGRKWERNRRLLTPAFHFDILKPYIGLYHSVSDTFLDRLAEQTRKGRSVDICPLVSRATLDTMLRCMLSYNDDTIQSLDTGHQHPYVKAVHRLGYLVIRRILNPLVYGDLMYSLTGKGREFKRLCDYVHQLSWDIIQSRKVALARDPDQLKKRHLDFLDILITARDPHGIGLTDMEIRDEVDTFMFEGHDTTASAISWTLYSLAKYPDMQKKVRQEVNQVLNGDTTLKHDALTQIPYTTCFIKEALRMFSPVPAATRRLVEPLEVDGRILPAGTILEIYPHLIHHHPDVWDNHQEFRPERFTPENSEGRDPFAFIPFSAGPRNCIGQNFAMNEIKVMVSRVVTRFQLRVDPAREPETHPEIVMRSKDGIYLHLEELT